MLAKILFLEDNVSDHQVVIEHRLDVVLIEIELLSKSRILQTFVLGSSGIPLKVPYHSQHTYRLQILQRISLEENIRKETACLHGSPVVSIFIATLGRGRPSCFQQSQFPLKL